VAGIKLCFNAFTISCAGCHPLNRNYSPPPLKRGIEGNLFKKSPLTPFFQRGGL
jgi:hypothetical protein